MVPTQVISSSPRSEFLGFKKNRIFVSQNDVLCVLWVEVKQKRRSYETDNNHCYACLAVLQRCRNSLSAQRRHYTCTGVCGQRFQHFRRPFSRHKGPKEAGWEGRSHRHTRISGEGFRPHRLRNNSQHLLHTGQRDARRSQVTPREPRLAGSLNPQRLPKAADRRLRSSHQAL